MEVRVRTINGIHNFCKDHSTQSITCSPWSTHVKPFPSLQKKFNANMEEKRKPFNSFTPAQGANNSHTFTFPKITKPIMRCNIDNKRVNKKQRKRKIEGHFVPTFAPAKVAMPTSPQPPAKAVVPTFPQLPAKTVTPATTAVDTRSSSQPHAQIKNYVTYVHLMENCAHLLPQLQTGQMKIRTERD